MGVHITISASSAGGSDSIREIPFIALRLVRLDLTTVVKLNKLKTTI
jgi:hypothetical protein